MRLSALLRASAGPLHAMRGPFTEWNFHEKASQTVLDYLSSRNHFARQVACTAEVVQSTDAVAGQNWIWISRSRKKDCLGLGLFDQRADNLGFNRHFRS